MKTIYEVSFIRFGNDSTIEISIIKNVLNKNNVNVNAYNGFFYAWSIDNNYVIPKFSELYKFPEILSMLLNEKYIKKSDNHEFEYKLDSRALLELI